MKCPFCGKVISAERMKCPYCGRGVPQRGATGAGGRVDSFESLRQSRELEKLLRYTPSAAGTRAGLVILEEEEF